jgi:hypothetical protein
MIWFVDLVYDLLGPQLRIISSSQLHTLTYQEYSLSILNSFDEQLFARRPNYRKSGELTGTRSPPQRNCQVWSGRL